MVSSASMRGRWLFCLAAGALLAMVECSNDSSTCDGGNCVDSGVPSVSGGGCDSSKPASAGGCAVDDSDGFFVSPSGADTNAGSKLAPFKTIGAGIAAASAAAKQPNVYVCAGSYPENLVIKNAPAGVALHGGFDCTSWSQTNATTTVAPAWITGQGSTQWVLHVDSTAALVEGLALTAPDALDPGATSQAVLIAASPGITFRRASVIAGAGADGVTPTPPAAVAAAMPGNNGGQNIWSPAITCPCSSDSSLGGQGGGVVDGGVVNPEAGAPIVNGDNTKGQPGLSGSQPQCNGGAGADGLVGKSGTSTGTLGEITALAGWIASPGGAGSTGGTAQGGGGGYANVGSPIFAGGSGGCGGCGGKGSVGGGGAGGSVAIVVLSSTLRIQSSTVRAGKGGNGADGGIGQAGQPGGTGGTGSPCIGGNGGTGGGGGPGGGGAGGVSIAIATSATSPDIDQQSTTLAGTAGVGGKDGSAAQTKAIDGITATVHAF
jgi:hypothetical protein